MGTFSLKLPDSLIYEIESLSKKRGITKSLLVREAVVEYLHHNPNKNQGSFGDLASDLCGSIKGPGDLSTNKNYLDGFGE